MHFPELADQITDCRKIVAFRNRLIHGYHVVSDILVWEIAQQDVPKLLHEIHALLREADREQGES